MKVPNMIDPMRVALKSVAFASAVAGLGAANAQAQTIIHVGGQNAIGDATLTTTAGVATLPNSGGYWAAAGGEGVVYTHLTSPPLKVPSTGPVTLKFTHTAAHPRAKAARRGSGRRRLDQPSGIRHRPQSRPRFVGQPNHHAARPGHRHIQLHTACCQRSHLHGVDLYGFEKLGRPGCRDRVPWRSD